MQHNRFPQEPTPATEPEIRISLFRALVIIVAVWGLVYLPGLGRLELKGEEGRRILPALEMLKTGNWVVPHIAGEPYLRKPPLINWAIAGSVKATGVVNEWSARLPSVGSVLLLGIGIVLLCRSWLGNERATAAALMTITMIGMIGKGRMAEIEALFTALSGIACVAWLAWRETGRSKWLYWTLPFIPIGIASLAKGPVHLVFFYAVVIGVVWSRKTWRELLHPAHFVGLLLAVGIFASWYLPYRAATAGVDVAEVWKGQTVGRFTGFDVKGWLLNIPRAASDLLPWVLLFPLMWKPVSAWDPVSYRGVRNALLISVVGMLLLPAVLPRYIMPAFPVFGLLFAVALFEKRWKLPAFDLVSYVSLGTGVLMCLYATLVVPIAAKRGELRQGAGFVNASVPAGATIYVLDPGFQPLLFYVQRPMIFLRDESEIPAYCPALLARDQEVKKIEKEFRDVKVLKELPGEGKRAMTLLSVGERK